MKNMIGKFVYVDNSQDGFRTGQVTDADATWLLLQFDDMNGHGRTLPMEVVAFQEITGKCHDCDNLGNFTFNPNQLYNHKLIYDGKVY